MTLELPHGSACVKVRLLSPNRVLDVPPSAFLTPDIAGTTYKDTPCLSFLIEHVDARGVVTRLLFDLGIRKDWENLPPGAVLAVKDMDIKISTEKDVADLLQEHGIEPASIDGIVFSHWHFDHVGDANRFPKTTRLIVGPGFKTACLPGYPQNPHSLISGDAFNNREVHELDFSASEFSIATLAAIDWFRDGSFYLLNTPGHAVGHLSALARTTQSAAGDTFVFLAGDVCHHAGELRPHPGCPLPLTTIPTFDARVESFKGANDYLQIHPEKTTDRPFYRPACGGFNLDAKQMQETAAKVARLDADERVFVLLAHDNWLLDVVDQFPKTIDRWKDAGWDEKSRWRFLKDFE